MEAAFWDASALIPICIDQQTSTDIDPLVQQYSHVVWWASYVEARSAFSRLIRMRQLTLQDKADAETRLERLASQWIEIEPTLLLRKQAASFIDRFPLRAADALQLAAAFTWALQRPHGEVFISGDRRLLDAAAELGFQTIET